MPGARLRTRRATRWVNSGLSMMTRTSGFAAMTASAASCIRRRIFESIAGIEENPTIARSPRGNRLGTPSAAMCAPPTPEKCAFPCVRSLIAEISAAPNRSPDSSPATRNTWGFMFSSERHAHNKDPRAICFTHDAFRIGDYGPVGDDRNARKPGAGNTGDRPRANRRQIEPVVLTGFRRFHQHASTGRNANAPVLAQLSDPSQHLICAFGSLHGQYAFSGHDSRLPNIESAACLQICKAKRNILPVPLRGRHATERSFRHQNFRRHLMCSNEVETLLFKQRAHAG